MRFTIQRRLVAWIAISLLFAFGATSAALASLRAQAGPYRVEIATDPAVILVGQPTKLVIQITDSEGKPVEGAQVRAIAQMPGMPMGEQEETALPQAGQPGVYVAPAQFAMAGRYEAAIQISGPQGAATAKIPLKTGQNTGSIAGGTTGGSAYLLAWLPWILGGLVLAFILYRMRRTGQRVNLRPLLNWRVIAGILLLVAVYLGSAWAVRTYTKPGHMSVIEAQAMDMTAMKPPVVALPVAEIAAKREPLESTVQYTGSAVAFQDQEVTPRVTGTISWMPFYPGDRVRQGQIVARLDTSELASRAREQAAGVAMVEHATMIAQKQYQQALGVRAQAQAQVQEAKNEVVGARSELAAARQDVTAAQDERAGALADLESAQTAITDAQAQLAAAQADQNYWREQLKRSQELVQSGALSRQAYQQDQAQAENANAKVRQAQARIQQANAAVRAAQSRIKKAEALIAGAQAKVAQMQAKVESRQARVAQAQDNARALAAAAEAAEHEIAHTQAGVRQAQAQWNTARVIVGYTEIRAEVDGVVTQRLVSPGQLVQPGQALLRISQIRPIRLQANVAESDLPNIQVGSRVRAWTMKDSKHPVEARVSAVFPAADPQSRTSIVEAILANTDRRFLPGDYITMSITTGQSRNALVVPASAIVWQPKATSDVLATAQTPSVWVITAGQPEKTVYTCTMHLQVKQDKPGKCPI